MNLFRLQNYFYKWARTITSLNKQPNFDSWSDLRFYTIKQGDRTYNSTKIIRQNEKNTEFKTYVYVQMLVFIIIDAFLQKTLQVSLLIWIHGRRRRSDNLDHKPQVQPSSFMEECPIDS